MAYKGYDLENHYDGTDLDSPLLPKADQGSAKAMKRMRRSLEVIELDEVPPIIKSCNGNVFWADEQCTRRVGLTSTEARLFLKLLQTDEPENYNYDELKDMFDDFGREQKMLQGLVDALPWWKIDTYRQRSIWRARIAWLDRMTEPRLWLLYLMARRKRILKKASIRVLERLREKRKLRLANGSPERGRVPPPNGAGQLDPPLQSVLSDAVETLEEPLEHTTTQPLQYPVPSNPLQHPGTVKIASHSPETRLGHFASRVRDSLSASRHHDSRSRSSQGKCPVFTRPYEATREDIKRQVESIMPKPTPYIVIGWFLRSASDPKERILLFQDPDQLFKELRRGESDLRGWRRFLSLKSLQGFGLYKCDISRGAHVPLNINPSQEAILAQLFLAYNASLRHPDKDVARAWQGWVCRNLNDNKENPLEGRYSLQLMYNWSSYRLSGVVAVPIMLSLAIGFWYMNGGGDVVTAWTLALYIVTTAAALIALMAIIGSLKDI